MDLRIKNKVALVAAASQGIGKAVALALAKEGAEVVICSRKEKELRETATEISSLTGTKVIPIVADVSTPVGVSKFVQTGIQSFGTVHILVNNAGGPPTGQIHSISDEEWNMWHETTLMSVIRSARAVLPAMVKQKWGRIITVVSFVAKQPADELLISSTLRPGILGLSKVLSNIYGKDNITVNAICPGYVLTNRQEELSRARAAEKKQSMTDYLEEIAKIIPARRLAQPEEIGDVVAFLASDRASYVNGVNLLVDGGLVKGIF